MAAYGFKPLRHLSGGQIRTNEYTVAIDYATAIYTGDPVKFVAGGTIELAAAGNVILGVFQGVSYAKSDGEVVFARYWPGAVSAATDVVALVIDDPMVSYSVFDDGDSDFLTLADQGGCADHVAGSGSALTGISAVALDTSGASNSVAGFKILRKVNRPGNVYGSANGDQVEVEVKVNEPFLAHHTAGI
jgi:hypothetical protein